MAVAVRKHNGRVSTGIELLQPKAVRLQHSQTLRRKEQPYAFEGKREGEIICKHPENKRAQTEKLPT